MNCWNCENQEYVILRTVFSSILVLQEEKDTGKICVIVFQSRTPYGKIVDERHFCVDLPIFVNLLISEKSIRCSISKKILHNKCYKGIYFAGSFICNVLQGKVWVEKYHLI